MSQAFSFTSPNPLLAQPNGAGENLIFRSDNAADSDSILITGLVSGTSTTDTGSLDGKFEVETYDAFETLSIANLPAAQLGVVSIYGQGTGATGDLRVDTLPANNDTLRIGLIGSVQTYTFKTTLTGGGTTANEIKIAATVALQATYIYEAISAGANAGTHYGSATTANAFVFPDTPIAAVVTLHDNLAVARQLAWVVDQSVGATISIRTMIGGVTGTLLASLSPGTTMAYDSFTLSSEDLTPVSLPALFTGSSDPISLNGATPVIRIKTDATDPIHANYQTSTDLLNWAGGATAITDFDNSYDILNPQFVYPPEKQVDYIRLNIITNTNDDTRTDVRVISG